jgi:long-chain acyl-CoA synthetase
VTSKLLHTSIGRTTARLARQLELALASVDLSLAQYRLLLQLGEGAEASTALARKLAVSAPSVTAVVDGLAQRGAVVRSQSEADRRRVSLALTDAGRVLLEAAETAVRVRLEEIASAPGDPLRAEEALNSLALWGDALEADRAQRIARRATVAVTPS